MSLSLGFWEYPGLYLKGKQPNFLKMKIDEKIFINDLSQSRSSNVLWPYSQPGNIFEISIPDENHKNIIGYTKIYRNELKCKLFIK